MVSDDPRAAASCVRRVVRLAALVMAVAVLATAAQAQSLGDFVSPGELARPHREFAGITQCGLCHAAGKGVTDERCLDCHDVIRAEVEQRDGFHGNLQQACKSCHPDHRGIDFDMVHFEEETFDHDATGFPLRGAHERAECTDCHEGDDYRSAEPLCAECHDEPHGAGASERGLLGDCEACHGVVDWSALPLPESVFDHNSASFADFALEGAHLETECEACHVDWLFVPLVHEACIDCHEDPHRAPFGNDCERCHATPESWHVPGFAHAETGYALEGLHRQVACTACHGDDVTRPLPHGRCDDCHTDIHEGRFAPRSCDECHSVHVPDFEVAEFDHALTAFPLEGEHLDVACEDCHTVDGRTQYAGVPTTCAGCHEDPHEGRFDPTPCEDCHQPAGWGTEDFDHDRTDFPLDGAHVDVACETCHGERGWSGIPYASCNDCHADENPHGPDLGPETCTDCHVTSEWTDISFDHDQTAFSLAPQHVEAECTECHLTGDAFAGLPMACLDCHAESRPVGHYTGGCESCHTGAYWVPAGLGDFGHEVTGFALHGAHARLECHECHDPQAPQASALPGCSDCHASDDPHRNLLGDRCDDCHTEATWYRSRWRHWVTGWPLRGSHRLAPCVDCHATGYVGTPTDCWRCHEAEAPMDVPAHLSPSFLDCASCHRTYTWSSPTFPH